MRISFSLISAAAVVIFGIEAHDARADAFVYGCGAGAQQEAAVVATGAGFCIFPAFPGPTPFESATVDLPGGILRADAIGLAFPGQDAQGNPNITTLGATGNGQLTDSLTIQGPPGWIGPVPVTLTLHVEGAFYGLGGASESIDLSETTSAGTASEFTLAQWDGEFVRLGADFSGPAGSSGDGSVPNGAPPTLLVPVGNPVHHANEGDGVEMAYTTSVTVEVDPSDPTVAIEGILGALADPDGSLVAGENEADFSDTAQFGVTLPNGFSFTSASGVFLSAAAPADVPEPASFGMMLAGLAGLGVLGRREFGQVKS